MKRIISLLTVLCLTVSLFTSFSPVQKIKADETALLTAEYSIPKKLTATFDASNIDKHGHITLSLTNEEILSAGYRYGDILNVKFLGKNHRFPFVANYTDVDAGSPAIFARAKDTNMLLAVNTGCFAEKYKLASKTTDEDGSFTWKYNEGITGPVKVKISLKASGAYLDDYQLRQVESSNKRDDYPELSDKEFANFREVTTSGMGRGVLYRTSSPINPSNNRNTYADEAIKEAGVTVILNLADNADTAFGYEGFDDTYYSTTSFKTLDLPVGFLTKEFEDKLADGLRFMADNSGVYAVHCKEGKDRAGYVSALLECFMGASLDEIKADYMTTFYNYYKISESDPGYDVIANGNIVKSLKNAFTFKKSDKKKDLSKRNLKKCAVKYFKKIGLTSKEIKALRKNLSVNIKNETRIKVFETSDLHGYIFDMSSGAEEKFEYRLPYIANVVNKARQLKAYDDVLLVDGGDIYQGTPVSNLTYGACMRAALDVMDYDAVTLGNHEFDWNVEKYATDPDGTLPAYSIGSFSGDPDIPVLASDLYSAKTNERTGFTKDYVIVEKAGKRIALIGYIPDYQKSIMYSKISPYIIDDNYKKLNALVKKVNEEEKPDVTIVMAHENPVIVAEALDPKDVDLVTGGHDHAGRYGISSKGVPYIQSDYYAKGYASATIIIDQNGSVSIEKPYYTKISGNPDKLYYTEDNKANAEFLDDKVLSIALESWSEISGEMSEVLGYIDTPVMKKVVISDNGATSGGNWITGLMLRKMQQYGCVAAFYNTGGIRTSFEIPEGETRRNITVGDIYSINPFNNFWLVYELTGAELAQQLVNGFILKNYGDQMSGLTFEYIDHGTSDAPDIEIVSITLDDGTKVDINDTQKTYRICTSNYSGTLPGGVFENKTSIVSEGDAPVDNVTIIELLREEAKENNGYIAVDTSKRGVRVKENALADAA